MKTLTVITTTYNRAYCLHQVYASLCRQTSSDFIWLIVDDGSQDETRDLVEGWSREGRMEIEYHYKTNGGMHTARNVAYQLVKTELNVIVDSDDWLCDDAVEKIISFWRRWSSDKHYGIAANNVSAKDGCVIGSPMPAGVTHCTLTDLSDKYHVKGDKKIIMKSDLSRLYPFPEFPSEKFYPASYKYKLLDQDYELLIMDLAVCVVDYNEDSMTFDKYAQYRTCCQGFAHYRNEMMRISKSPKRILRESVHYIAESRFAGVHKYIRKSTRPLYVAISIPAGLLWYYYLLRTSRKY